MQPDRQPDEPPADVGTEAQERDPEIGHGTAPGDDGEAGDAGPSPGGRP